MAAGIAKPSPSLPPPSLNIRVLIPITLPSISTSGPPLLPGLSDASVCMYTMGLCHDVAVGIDDDSCTNRVLADNSRCVGVTVVFRRSVPRHYDLYHRW